MIYTDHNKLIMDMLEKRFDKIPKLSEAEIKRQLLEHNKSKRKESKQKPKEALCLEAPASFVHW